MQNDSTFYHWDCLIKSHNWQDSSATVVTVTESNSHIKDSHIMSINLDYLLLWLFAYAVIMMLLLFVSNGKAINKNDR